MQNRTMLEIVQNIFSTYMDGDTINSISDLTETTDVANIVKDVYLNLVATKVIEEQKELTKIDSLADSTRPTYLRLPDDVSHIYTLEYNTDDDVGETRYRELAWCEPEDFLRYIRGRKTESDNTVAMPDINGSTVIPVRNNQHPRYYTSFDDEHIVCDSYKSTVDTVLQTSKTRAYVSKIPNVTISDSYTFTLSYPHMRILESEAAATAVSVKLKQSNPNLERMARNSRTRSEDQKRRSGPYDKRNNFGR